MVLAGGFFISSQRARAAILKKTPKVVEFSEKCAEKSPEEAVSCILDKVYTLREKIIFPFIAFLLL